MLPAIDMNYLGARAPGHSVTIDDGMICVIVPSYALGPGFDRSHCDLLLRIAPGYPDVAPDMWWFSPAVRRLDGQAIAATQVTETYFNRPWQRWSRHLGPGQWKPGIDSLESYMSLVRRELTAAAPQVRAA